MWIVLLAAALAAEPGEHLKTHAVGGYALASTEAETLAIAEAAVDVYLAPMGLWDRTRARKRLVAAALPCDSYALELAGSRFSTRCDDTPVIVAEDGGAAIPYLAPSGKTYDVNVTFEESELVLEFAGVEADQTSIYRFSESGNLLLQREIRPHSLDGTLTIFYTYTKAP